MIYLASPYSDPDSNVRFERYRAACIKTAQLMKEGLLVFSPIAHSHNVALFGAMYGHALPLDFEYWQKWAFEMLLGCDAFMVLRLPGWQESKGVMAELELAQAGRMNIQYIDP